MNLDKNQELDQSQCLHAIESAFQTIGLPLTKYQADQFLQYYQLLVDTNKVMNLTAITEFDEVLLKHFLDSVLIYLVFPFKEDFPEGLSDNINRCFPDSNLSSNSNRNTNVFLSGSIHSVIDVGTGAGFPGIPLKIVFPDLHMVLLDSLNKRVGFLNTVIEQLQLKDIFAVHSRAEDAARNPIYRDQFDLCVSRAVANLSLLSEFCLPFVKPGGLFVSYKSSDINQECENAKNAIHILGGRMERVEKSVLPGSDIERSFVLIRKERGTPKKYPRKAGIPSRNPL